MLNHFSILAVGVAALSTPALAADLSTPAKPQYTAPVTSTNTAYDWTGFYAGANAGYGWGDGTISAGGATATDDIDGYLGGAQVGYNYDLGGFVLGVETDLQFSDVKYTETVGGFTFDAGVDWFGTARIRAGAAVDDFLPYVTGGLAYGGGYAEVTAGGANVRQEENHVGWTAGAGVEFAATDRITLKGEYLYVDLGEEDYNGGTYSLDAEFHTVRAGVNFKF